VPYRFIRYQSSHPNRHGRFPGIFAVVNGLAWAGRLTVEQYEYWRTNNDWYHATLPLPPTEVYHPQRNPGAIAWFRATATRFLEPVAGYLAILDVHGLGHVEMRSDTPGRIVYEDDYQVIAAPDPLPRMPGRPQPQESGQ
jgi:hypothetical protein